MQDKYDEVVYDKYKSRRLDETFFNAFMFDYYGADAGDMINEEYEDLARYDDLTNLAITEDIVRSGLAEGQTIDFDGLIDRSMDSYTKATEMIANDLREDDRLREELLHYAKYHEVGADKVAVAIGEYNHDKEIKHAQNKFDIKRAIYASGLFGYTKCEADAYFSTLKTMLNSPYAETDAYKQLKESYTKVSKYDPVTALDGENREQAIADYTDLQRSLLNFKMHLVDTKDASPNDKEYYKKFVSTLAEKKKEYYDGFTKSQKEIYESAQKEFTQNELDYMYTNILVANRAQKKLASPNYNFSIMTMRGARFADDVIKNANDKTKVVAKVKDYLTATRPKDRAMLLGQILSSDSADKVYVSDNFFSNGVMIDEFMRRTEVYKEKEDKPFIEQCKYNEAITNGYKETYKMLNQVNYNNNLSKESRANVREAMMNSFIKDKAHKYIEGAEIANQLMLEASKGDVEKYYELIDASVQYSKIYVGGMMTSLVQVADKHNNEELKAKVMEIAKMKLDATTSEQEYAEAIARCDACVYSLKDAEFNDFTEMLNKNNESMREVAESMYNIEGVDKKYIDALTLSNRQHLTSLDLEKRASVYNRRLYTAMQDDIRGMEPQEQAEINERFLKFIEGKDNMLPAIVNENRVYTRRLADDIQDAINAYNSKKFASQPGNANALLPQGASANVPMVPEPSEDAKDQVQEQKPDQMKSFVKGINDLVNQMKSMQDYDKDMKTLQDLKAKYSDPKKMFDEDYQSFWYGLGLALCIFAGFASIFLGFALPGLAVGSLGTLGMAAIGGLYCFNKREQIMAGRRADAKVALAIAQKYGLKTTCGKLFDFLGNKNPFKLRKGPFMDCPELYYKTAISELEAKKTAMAEYNDIIQQMSDNLDGILDERAEYAKEQEELARLEAAKNAEASKTAEATNEQEAEQKKEATKEVSEKSAEQNAPVKATEQKEPEVEKTQQEKLAEQKKDDRVIIDTEARPIEEAEAEAQAQKEAEVKEKETAERQEAEKKEEQAKEEEARKEQERIAREKEAEAQRQAEAQRAQQARAQRSTTEIVR